MPQSPLAGGIDSVSNGVSAMHQTRGGALTKLNMTVANLIKAGKGRVARLIVVVAGSGGTITLNDSATLGGAAAGNAFFSAAGGLVAGTVIDLDWPCANGIVLSAIGTGVPVLAISYR